MEKEKNNAEDKEKILPENDTIKSSAEAAKTLADLAKESMKYGKSSDSVTKADQESSSEYNSALSETLRAINKEISECTDSEKLSNLYKQREDVMNRMREEKENQRNYNNEREKNDRDQSTGFFAMVAAVALGAGAIATKLLLDNKKS